MDGSRRLYAELGVAPDCADDEIERAFRRRRAEVHPDRLGGDETLLRRLNAVYAILGTPTQRQLYDLGWIEDADVLGGEDIAAELDVEQLTMIVGGAVAFRGHKIVIPAGSLPGDVVRVAGAGEPGKPPGALVVTLREQPGPFRRRGLDLEVSSPITWLELYRRDVLEVSTPWGASYVRVPDEGPLLLRLPGAGMRRLGAAGDLYVHLQPVMPPAGDPKLLADLARLQTGVGVRLRELKDTHGHRSPARKEPAATSAPTAKAANAV